MDILTCPYGHNVFDTRTGLVGTVIFGPTTPQYVTVEYFTRGIDPKVKAIKVVPRKVLIDLDD